MNEETKNISVLEGKTVMWVEDDAFLSDIIARKLSNKNCTLLRASNADETFNILKDNTPDIIMLDILLPGMNGYEILEKLKGDDKTKKVPVIILSNFGQKSEVEKGMKLGAEKFLIKATLTLDEIIDEIGRTFKKDGGSAPSSTPEAPIISPNPAPEAPPPNTPPAPQI